MPHEITVKSSYRKTYRPEAPLASSGRLQTHMNTRMMQPLNCARGFALRASAGSRKQRYAPVSRVQIPPSIHRTQFTSANRPSTLRIAGKTRGAGPLGGMAQIVLARDLVARLPAGRPTAGRRSATSQGRFQVSLPGATQTGAEAVTTSAAFGRLADTTASHISAQSTSA
jgi:uncharacterized lipoprotein YmbA